MWTRESFVVCRPVMLLLLLLAPAEAQVPEAAGEAVTPRERLDDLRARAIAPEVPAERLGLILRPFEAEEIEGVVRHWMQQAQGTQAEISLLLLETPVDIARGTSLDSRKARELDRMWAAMKALRSKGGDIASFVIYRDSIRGLSVDAKDVGGSAMAIQEWALKEDGGVRWLKNTIFAILTLLIFKLLSGLAGKVTAAAVERSHLDISEGLRRFFLGIVRKLVLVIGVILALSMLGVDIGPFIAAIGVGGFVVGFALQETLGNFAAGVMILMYRPFEIGNTVNAAGVTGKVIDINLVSTRFKTGDNQLIIVPNGKVWGDVIQNVTVQEKRRVDLVFGIGYDDDIDKAERILTEIVESHPKVLADPAPSVRLSELADSSVNFVVRPWTRTSDHWDVRCDITRSVKKRFDEEGITIPYPQTEVHLRPIKD